MNITIYKNYWYPTLEPHIHRSSHHQFTYLFYQITNALIKKYDNVKIVDLPFLENTINVLGNEVSISDCDLLIQVNDRVILFTFSDMVSNAQQLIFSRNNPNDILIWPNYKSHEHIYQTAKFQVKGFPYVARYAAVDMDVYYNFRQTTPTNDKIFFRGNYTALPRNVIYSLLEHPYREHYSGVDGLDVNSYFESAIQHRVGLSIPGVAEFCYRDIEYMAIGLPILKFEFLNTSEPPLIPNIHYISIPRIDTKFEYERSCGEENFKTYFQGRNSDTDKYADLYYQRYFEVKDDMEFLKFISDNARQYYLEYCSPQNRLKHILNLLEI